MRLRALTIAVLGAAVLLAGCLAPGPPTADTAATHVNPIPADVPQPAEGDGRAPAGDQYRLGLGVQHNSGNLPGAGSCIFLHQTVLVQVPAATYRMMQPGWGLPPA